MIREFKVSVICYFLQEGVIGPKLNLVPVGTVGYSLSGLYLLTNPARLNLPGTKVPAGIALKVTEVITHGEDQVLLTPYYGQSIGEYQILIDSYRNAYGINISMLRLISIHCHQYEYVVSLFHLRNI